MSKAFIQVMWGHNRIKVFIKDIKKLSLVNKRKTPPIPHTWAEMEVIDVKDRENLHSIVIHDVKAIKPNFLKENV